MKKMTMKLGALCLAVSVSLGLGACGSKSNDGSSDGEYTVAHVLNSNLGDQGFYDDAERGIQALKKKGYKTTTLQSDPNNPAQWKSNLQSVSGKNRMVVTGTSQMVDTLKEVAGKNPKQHYISYDAVVDAPNVASITYAQNEGAFLAGVLAALVTTDKAQFPMSNPQKTVGMVGGMNIPVINDFAAGFKAGVKAVDPSIKVLVSYVGSFTDSAKGYDQAKAMYDQGADVVFQVAAGSGIGVLKAAADKKAYAIGVDSNQNALQPGYVLASMEKNLGLSIEKAVEEDKAGKLKFGTTTVYGLKNDGVQLDFEKNNNIVPKSVITKVDDYKKKVVDGEIKVPHGS